ncbi:MAG: class IV adenylate cyclase [bacterium]|nr:class IV adenylate cyclase [bacterium]
MREIEIKLRVRDLKALETRIQESGCVLSEPIHQHDVIYSLRGSSREFENAKKGDVIVRIRRQDNKAELNLKQQCSNEMDNLEYETEVKDPDATHQMLLLLGWRPSVEVKKIRRKGKIGSYEICLDRVEELGDFVELENMTEDDADPNKVREELFGVLESLGLSRQAEEIRGYDTQIFKLRHPNQNNPE